MPFEIETQLVNHKGQMLDVFIFYTIKSTGYYMEPIQNGIAFDVTWKNNEYPALDEIQCFDFDNNPYYPNEDDFELWIGTIKELVNNHFRRIAA